MPSCIAFAIGFSFPALLQRASTAARAISLFLSGDRDFALASPPIDATDAIDSTGGLFSICANDTCPESMCQYMLGKNAGLNFVLAWASIVVFGRWIGFAATRKMRMGRPQQTFRCAADCPVVQVGSGVQSPHFGTYWHTFPYWAGNERAAGSMESEILCRSVLVHMLVRKRDFSQAKPSFPRRVSPGEGRRPEALGTAPNHDGICLNLAQ